MNEITYRPWGSYEVLKEGERFKVKLIVVQPKQRLSLQKHKHREENWTVVKGVANVTVGKENNKYREGETIHIPKKCLHRLENTTDEEIQIIEVQSGDYLGEDDIERFEDDYNRIKK